MQVESPWPAEASLFADSRLSPHGKRAYALVKPGEATQLGEIIERLEGEITSSESSLLCWNRSWQITLPDKNYVKKLPNLVSL